MTGQLRPIVINQSGVKEYLACRRLFGWKRVARIEPEGRRSALEIGIAVHAALAVFHSEKPKEEALPYIAGEDIGKAESDEARLAVAAAALAEMPSEKEALAVHTAVKMLTRRAGIQSAFEDKSLAESDEITRRTLEGYFDHWKRQKLIWTPIRNEVQFLVEVQPGWWEVTFGPDSITAAAGDSWNEVVSRHLEAAWEALPRSGVWLRGRADNLAVVPGVGLYDVDYKTAGRMDPRDMMKYELDMQLTFYIYAITKQLTMDAVRQGKSPIMLKGAIIDLLVKTKVPQYARQLFTRSNAELSEFELEIVEYGGEIRQRYTRVAGGEDWKIVFGKNTQHCFQYGVCPMREVCLKDTPVRRQLYKTKGMDYVDEAQQQLDAAYLKSLLIPCEHCGGADIPGGNLCADCGRVTGVECSEPSCQCHARFVDRS